MKQKEKEPKQEDKDILKNCPHCHRKMSWIEGDVGDFRQWCYWCEASFLAPLK